MNGLVRELSGAVRKTDDGQRRIEDSLPGREPVLVEAFPSHAGSTRCAAPRASCAVPG